jgi:hypothetical protein
MLRMQTPMWHSNEAVEINWHGVEKSTPQTSDCTLKGVSDPVQSYHEFLPHTSQEQQPISPSAYRSETAPPAPVPYALLLPRRPWTASPSVDDSLQNGRTKKRMKKVRRGA